MCGGLTIKMYRWAGFFAKAVHKCPLGNHHVFPVFSTRLIVPFPEKNWKELQEKLTR